MTVLLIGANGQLGWALRRSLAPLGPLTALTREQLDLSDAAAVHRCVLALKPRVVVNAAAYTAVDRAEQEPALAHAVNAQAPEAMADAAAQLGALLVHYSTDYVFRGDGESARSEDAATGPRNVYGHSKLAGETAVRASGARHLLLRTSWVYAARGQNFPRTMLRLAQEREQLRVVADQIGAPTGADLIADVTAHAIRAVERDAADLGTYHLVAAGETSWHGLASFVIEQARALRPDLPWKTRSIEPIASIDYPTPAQRPLNSRLDGSRLATAFGLQLPDWRDGVRHMLSDCLGTP